MGHISAGVHVGCFSFPFSQQFSGLFDFSICIASVIYSSTVPRVPASHHIISQVAGCRFGLAIPGGSSLASSDLEKGGKVGLGFSFPLYMCLLGFFLCILWLFVVGLGWDQWCVDIWCI